MAALSQQIFTAPVYMCREETNGLDKPKSGVHRSDCGHKDSGLLGPVGRSSDDGYNWRKYGQKVMKGSETPRSYYKCTRPNCEVKKILECSCGGQITEIVYKGTHDHPKPQPGHQYSAGALMSTHEENAYKVSVIGQTGLSAYNGQTPNFETIGTPVQSPKQATGDSMAIPPLKCVNDEVDDDDPYLKRRRTDFGTPEATPAAKPIREPRLVVQTTSEVDILDDGYRWRKYGQKVVRGNPNPRSYYKCTMAGCTVRKHVERAPHDAKSVITMYEGKHNHDLPTARNSRHDLTDLGKIKES